MGIDDDLEPADAPLLDAARLRNYALFAWGALRRRKRLVGATTLAVLVVTLGLLAALPKTYHVETKVLAQSNAALTIRADGVGGDVPTRTAAETILRRDKLAELVQRLDLVKHYHDHRAPISRARDAVLGVLGPEPTEQEKVDAMIELLEKRLAVWTSEGGATVSIAIDWPDPEMACRILDMAEQDYLESRYAQEITALGESAAILESHTSSSLADVNTAVDALRAVVSPRAARSAATPVKPAASFVQLPRSAVTVTPQGASLQDGEIAKLEASIDGKQRALDDLEEFRARRLSDLQARLAEQRAIYTENHPAVVDLKQAIAAVSDESPQVRALRTEIAQLRDEHSARKAASAEPTPIAMPAPFAAPAAREAGPLVAASDVASDVLRLGADLREERDPDVMYARGQVRDAMDKYAALRSRIQAAQIDLETAKAAFKYRYAVVTPAHLPKKPAKPNAPFVLLAALLGGAMAGWLVAVLAELRRGLVVERWQLEDLLGHPVLADVELPQLPRADVP